MTMGPTANSKPNLTSDALHNRNCYAYFLQLKPAITSQVIELLPQFSELQSVMSQKYRDDYAYGNLYSDCIAALEELIDDHLIEKINALDDLVQAIYHNDNHILEQSAEWINDIGADTRPQNSDTAKKIEEQIKDSKNNINQLSPIEEGSIPRLVYSLFAQNFKPQLETNLPSIKNYSYKHSSDPIEYRFSTQAQRHNGKVRNSPLFQRWLEINAEKSSPRQAICHIYFNNLGFDRSSLSITGSKERDLTLKLHELEENPKLKTLVITLPAHEGLMGSSDYKITSNRLSPRSVFNELLTVAKGKGHESGISDFFISDKARPILFGNAKNEDQILKHLLHNSFKAQGLAKSRFISTAQRQAVWVHFIKYELTNYILETVKPKSFNFSCKDAIDRGALSSSYYNLIKSFTLNAPITKNEFERSLDAAAANVKGRGMNFHRRILWNAINEYVNANYEDLIKNKSKLWLIYWRDMNCPHQRVENLLKVRLKQTVEQFNNLPDEKAKIKQTGLKLLHTAKLLNIQNASGKRLLFEVISRTSGLLLSSSVESKSKYKKLANELKIKHPTLHVIGGIMEIFLGILLYLPSFGYTQTWIDHGTATANAGFFAHNKTKLRHEMLEFTATMSRAKEMS